MVVVVVVVVVFFLSSSLYVWFLFPVDMLLRTVDLPSKCSLEQHSI